MGIIRTLLALAVVLHHSYGIGNSGRTMTGGIVSVQLFYIISGFYMAMILNEKYKSHKNYYRLFLSNRFLRLFPTYWTCLLVVILVCIGGKIFFGKSFYLEYWINAWHYMGWAAIVLIIFSNIFLLGSDTLMFTGLNHGTGRLEFTGDPYLYNPMTTKFMLIPQIWSVGVEITFYLVAPFLVRTKWFWQLGIILASLVLRYFIYHYSYSIPHTDRTELLDFDPWNYRFFPLEIAFFLSGSLAYRFYCFIKTKKISRWLNYSLWAVVLYGIITYPKTDTPSEVHLRWGFYLFFVLVLPFIFLQTSKNKIDRFIGELSFPVYVCHHFIMFLWRQYFFDYTQYKYLGWFGITTAVSSIAFAVLLWFAVIKPIERYRQRRVLNSPMVIP